MAKYTTKNWEKIGPARMADAAKDPQIYKSLRRPKAGHKRKKATPGGYSSGGSTAEIKTVKNGLATYKYVYKNPRPSEKVDVEMFQDQVKRKYSDGGTTEGRTGLAGGVYIGDHVNRPGGPQIRQVFKKQRGYGRAHEGKRGASKGGKV